MGRASADSTVTSRTSQPRRSPSSHSHAARPVASSDARPKNGIVAITRRQMTPVPSCSFTMRWRWCAVAAQSTWRRESPGTYSRTPRNRSWPCWEVGVRPIRWVCRFGHFSSWRIGGGPTYMGVVNVTRARRLPCGTGRSVGRAHVEGQGADFAASRRREREVEGVLVVGHHAEGGQRGGWCDVHRAAHTGDAHHVGDGVAGDGVDRVLHVDVQRPQGPCRGSAVDDDRDGQGHGQDELGLGLGAGDQPGDERHDGDDAGGERRGPGPDAPLRQLARRPERGRAGDRPVGPGARPAAAAVAVEVDAEAESGGLPAGAVTKGGPSSSGCRRDGEDFTKS